MILFGKSPESRDIPYLKAIMASHGYSDWANDPDALPACERLAALGFCRIVHDGPSWRASVGPDHLRLGVAFLEGLRP